MLVRNIMTPSPVCVEPRTRLKDAVDLMYAADVRHVPVLEGRMLVGILSERDLRSLWDIAFDPTVNDGRLYQHRVAEVMSHDPVTISDEDTIDDVIDLLVEHRIGAVPVIDADGALTGIVSYVDVLRAARGKLG